MLNFQINNRNERKDHFENGIEFDGLKWEILKY